MTKAFSFTADELDFLRRVVLVAQADGAQLDNGQIDDLVSKLEAKFTHRHVVRGHLVRLVAPYVKKKGCEVPLVVFETECGKLYARSGPDFASRYVPVT